jgi:peptide/nickel transport system ATP-binding protein
VSDAAPILEVEGLSVVYDGEDGSFHAVEDVSFSLHRDEVLGLVGESGSGKTTLALAIVRYLAENGRIASGSIRFDGIDLVRLGEGALRRVRGSRISMVYQDPAAALNPAIRVGEQIAEVFRTHFHDSQRAARRRSIEMLARVHMPDPEQAYDRYPHEFSGGQQQRVVIAMALAANPDLLILDEPTTGLDATVEAEILDLFSEVRQSVNAGMLFISHDISLIAQMCDRIGVLYGGRFVELGPSDEVLTRPTHPYTRGLLFSTVPFGATKGDLRLVPIRSAAAEPPPAGCAYQPRCSFARERCVREAPPLERSGPEQVSRCFFHAEVRVAPAPAQAEHIGEPVASGDNLVVEVQEVHKTFRAHGRELVAVSGVSLSLGSGRILGLVGESGSGKTTTARVIAGLVAPSEGQVLLRGEDVTKPVERRAEEARRAVQMVFQHPDSTLNPRHRVRKILRRTVKKLTPLRGGELDRRVEEMVSAVHLEPRHLDAFPDQLSGGQRQRVAIARAFAPKPDVVLCDEPTSALDVSIQAAILNLLVDLQAAEHASYVFISHDLATVRYLADDIAVMYLGEIVEIGPARRVFEPPLHPYTESLLSAVRPLGDQGPDRRIRLRGPIPSLADRPLGCPFHPRCPRKVGPVCEEVPPWQTTEEGHRYRCVIPPDELRARQNGG